MTFPIASCGSTYPTKGHVVRFAWELYTNLCVNLIMLACSGLHMFVIILFECLYRMFYDSVRSLPANLSLFFSAKRLACACESRFVTSCARPEVCAPGRLGRSRAIRLYCTEHATPSSCLVCPPENSRNHLTFTMALKLGACNAVAIIKYQYLHAFGKC